MPGVRQMAAFLPKELKQLAYAAIKTTTMAQRVKQQITPPPMAAETRLRLVELYRRPNEELSHFLGRDLSHWNA